jgi:hypothetical protein
MKTKLGRSKRPTGLESKGSDVEYVSSDIVLEFELDVVKGVELGTKPDNSSS